ncbi:MAG: PAS domain-containing protein, partial [Anaerolineae bacterium]
MNESSVSETASDEMTSGEQALGDRSSDYIMRYDRAHRHIFANQAALDVTGLSREQYIGKTHREIGFPEHLCALWERGIDHVFATGEPYAEVFEWDSAQGPIFVDWRLTAEFVDGQVASVLGVSRDVTALMLSERALRERQAELDAIYDNAPLVMLLVDADGRVRRANRFAQSYSDFPVDAEPLPRVGDLLGCVQAREGLDICGSGPDCAACAARQAVLDTLATGTAREQIEARLRVSRAAAPQEVHLMVSTTPVTIGDERLALVSMVDITSRVAAENSLRMSQTLLEETQRLASVGGWQLDVLTGQVTWTSEVYRIHEVPPDTPLGLLDALSFYPEPDRTNVAQAVERAISQGTPYDLECHFETARGRRLYVRTIGSAEWRDGRVVRLFGAFQDITGRKSAELA